MPLYDYACTKCERVHEVRHGFDESYDRPCESCGAPLRRIFNPAPVLFKGSGFYVTDSRSARTKSDKPKPDKPKDDAGAKRSDAPAGDGKAAGKSTESAA